MKRVEWSSKTRKLISYVVEPDAVEIIRWLQSKISMLFQKVQKTKRRRGLYVSVVDSKEEENENFKSRHIAVEMKLSVEKSSAFNKHIVFRRR